MPNELIFFLYIISIAASVLLSLKIGKEALIAWICLSFVWVNFFVVKQIVLFQFSATASDALSVGITLGLNLLQEHHGRAAAQKTIGLSFFLGLCYVLFSLLHLSYTPSLCDCSQEHYRALLYPMPRLLAASFITYLIVQQIDCRIYEMLQTKFVGKQYILRNYISCSITQGIDTILFTFFALYGIVENPIEIVSITYAIKLCTMLCLAPFLSLSKKILPVN